MSQFDDIRPYHDDEVAPAIARVLSNPELIRAVLKLRFPKIGSKLPWLFGPIVQRVLKRQLRDVSTVKQLQDIVGHYLQGMMDSQVSELTVSGLERLDPSKSYVFISNHRDIAMDPAFVNWTLYTNGFDTVRIAIGDNLLTKPYVSDLMRLNKSFIVKRTASSPREKLKSSKHLSAYIHHSITEENSHIWIAQREGRAKDGKDATNTALVSMLALTRPKPQLYADFIRELNIVPVSISYEWDPCDTAKAKELYTHQFQGNYEKAEHEDVASIALGIAGKKGHVHVAFGEVLHGDYDNAEQVARAIDQQVWGNYVLHPSNHLAYQKLHNRQVDLPVSAKGCHFDPARYRAEALELDRRLESVPEEQQSIFLGIYANPVDSFLKVSQ